MGRDSPRWAVRKQNIKLTTPPHLREVVPYKYRWGSVGSFSFCLLIVAVRHFWCVLRGALRISVLTGVSVRCGSWWLSEEPRWAEYTAVSPWWGLVFQYWQCGSVTDRVNSFELAGRDRLGRLSTATGYTVCRVYAFSEMSPMGCIFWNHLYSGTNRF